MSIDDLARSAAQDLRATAAGTFDVDGGLERIPVSSRRRTIAQQGTALVMVVLVLIVGAFAVRPHLGAVPEPMNSGTPTPSASLPPIVPRPTGPFEALVVRGTSLVAIDAQGKERAVRDLAPLGLTKADLEYAYVSTAGWLTFVPGGSRSQSAIGYEFVNLLAPHSPPVLVRGSFDKWAWSPDGTRLATTASGNGAIVIDAATGARTAVRGTLPGGGPSLIWTADGTGIVVIGPAGLAVAPVDGGPLQDEVPQLWERGGHSITAGGFHLDKAACAGESWTCSGGLVQVVSADGAATTLYKGDVPDATLADATLSYDGRSTYLLLVPAAPRELLVARSDAQRHPTVLATVPVITTDVAGIQTSPDDSMVTVLTDDNPNAVHPTLTYYVVPLDGSPAHAALGTFAGWVPSAVVDAIAAAR